MAIYYCDFIDGDDGTSDGTNPLTPYKTITSASTSRTGGDEVRVAKSPDNTSLSGTLAFVDDSNIILTSVDLTGELSPGDFVGKLSESIWWEVITVTTNSLTLYQVYTGTTETVTSNKLGYTDTGQAAYGEHIHDIMSSGTSISSRLKISGGWDLTTQIQTGFTHFRQMNSTFNTRNGYGVYVNAQNYLEIEKLGFLRYEYGIFLYISNNNNLNYIDANSNGQYGINFNRSGDITLNYINSNSNGRYGILFFNSDNNNVNNLTCNSTANAHYYGIKFDNSDNNIINNLTCNNNGEHGCWLYSFNHNIINNLTCNNNGHYGFYLSRSTNNIITDIICNDNYQSGFYIHEQSNYNDIINITCNDNRVSGLYITFYSNNNSIINFTCNDNGFYGIETSYSMLNKINNLSMINNGLEVMISPNQYFGEVPVLNIQHFNTTGDNRCYYEHGITYRDITDARSTQCLKYSPTSDTYYIRQEFFFATLNGVEKNVSFYIKDDAAFNGDVQAALYFMEEKLSGWLTIPTTTDYVQHTLTAQAVDIPEDGVLELRIKGRGTAGNVFVDDLSIV